jgi:hypothetical protein
MMIEKNETQYIIYETRSTIEKGNFLQKSCIKIAQSANHQITQSPNLCSPGWNYPEHCKQVSIYTPDQGKENEQAFLRFPLVREYLNYLFGGKMDDLLRSMYQDENSS